jgi:hypothetical protein
MKTLLVYLQARVTGKNLTWIDAQYAANNINVEESVCNRVHATCDKVNAIIDGVEKAKEYAHEEFVNKPAESFGRALNSSFGGRLFVCMAQGYLDVDYLFHSIQP